MGESKQQLLNLNRETAMRLWNKSFGKETKVSDFAGRIIAKGAYDDRNSKFGWNVDHILPQSRGGTTVEHNLICCHIKTNDEKSNIFPCFNANGKAFEIIKVQNHYEIRAKGKETEKESNSDKLDLYDSASGVRFFKKLKGLQNKKRFFGTVFIRLNGLTNTALVDFIEKMLEQESLSFKIESSSYGANLIIVAHNYNMLLKEDSSELLDKCVLMNTYLSNYFVPCEYIKGFDVYYRVDCFEDKFSMYKELANINYTNMNYKPGTSWSTGMYSQQSYQNSLFVNGLVLENTKAGEKVTHQTNSEYTEYNFVFTNLSQNLKKEVSGK